MIKRTCPECGATRYSADDSGTWVCECGRRLTPELNEAPESEKRCEYCNSEYDTELKAQYIRWHTPNDGTAHDMKVNFCPNCGRKIGRIV